MCCRSTYKANETGTYKGECGSKDPAYNAESLVLWPYRDMYLFSGLGFPMLFLSSLTQNARGGP